MPSLTTLAPLSPSDLRRVLTDVRGSLISQYTALFGYSGVEIRFTGAALDEICRKASERGGGARGLRGIMVSLLRFSGMYQYFTFVTGVIAARVHVRSAVSVTYHRLSHIADLALSG